MDIKKCIIKIFLAVLMVSIVNGFFVNYVYAKDASTVDDWMQEAKDFIKDGEEESTIDQKMLKDSSDTLYNLLLAVGMIVAVLVGMILGIKYMMGSVEEKADLKQTLIAYVVGCFVIFGAFGIWKLVVQIFSEI